MSELISSNPRYRLPVEASDWLKGINENPQQLRNDPNAAKNWTLLNRALNTPLAIAEFAVGNLIEHYGVLEPRKTQFSTRPFELVAGLAHLVRWENGGINPKTATQEHRSLVENKVLHDFAPYHGMSAIKFEKFVALVRLAVVWGDTSGVLDYIDNQRETLSSMTPDEFKTSNWSSNIREKIESFSGPSVLSPDELNNRFEQERLRLARTFELDIPFAQEKMRELVVSGVRDNFGIIDPNIDGGMKGEAKGVDRLLELIMGLETSQWLQTNATTWPPTRENSWGRTIFTDYPYTLDDALTYPWEKVR